MQLKRIVVLVLVLPLFGCSEQDDPRLDLLTETESRPYEGVPLSEERVNELRTDIKEYEDEVDSMVQDYGRIASFQKMLANELIQAEMYEPALDALERAMEIQNENAVLFYLAGVAAARSARAHILDGEETDYLDKAERLFREALELRPDYHDALFGVAVLLAFDLDRPDDALPYAQKLSRLETGEPSVKFLLANILVRNGMNEEAAAVYDELARSAPSAEQRQQARENRDALEAQ